MKAFEMTKKGWGTDTVYIPVEYKDEAMAQGYEFPHEMNFEIDCEWFLDLKTGEKTLKPCKWGE